MDDILTCELCMERFCPGNRDPLVLQCGHTFCRSCLINVSQELVFRCPSCRRPQHNVDVAELPVNYKLLGATSETRKTETCVEHGDVQNYWCQECLVPLCVLCIIVDHQGHEVVKGKSFLTEKKGLLESHVQMWTKNTETRMSNKLHKIMVDLKSWCQNEGKVSKTRKDIEILLTQINQNLESTAFDDVNSAIRNMTLDTESFGPENISNHTGVVQNASNADTNIRTSYCIQNNNGQRAFLYWKDGMLRMSSYSDRIFATDLQLKIPTEVYLELSIKDNLLGCVVIQPWYHLRRAQQFAALCLGTFGVSYLGASFIEVRFQDEPGEYLLGGWYLTSQKGVPSNRDLMTDLEWGGRARGEFREGIVLGASIGGVSVETGRSGFGICIRGQLGNTLNCPFGEVVSGLDVVKKARQHYPVTEVKITGCGIIVSNLNV